MTCRHEHGDPTCSSYPDQIKHARQLLDGTAPEFAKARKLLDKDNLRRGLPPETPDSRNYSIEDIEQVGPHIVVKVLYPNCAKCSYEGRKVMVFLDVRALDVAKWKTIDPHFRDPQKKLAAGEAPPPAARFPASAEGWADAMAYAASRGAPPKRSTKPKRAKA